MQGYMCIQVLFRRLFLTISGKSISCFAIVSVVNKRWHPLPHFVKKVQLLCTIVCKFSQHFQNFEMYGSWFPKGNQKVPSISLFGHYTFFLQLLFIQLNTPNLSVKNVKLCQKYNQLDMFHLHFSLEKGSTLYLRTSLFPKSKSNVKYMDKINICYIYFFVLYFVQGHLSLKIIIVH